MLKVVPLEKKSIEDVCDFSDENGRGFVVYMWYRWGHALAEQDDLYEVDLIDKEITDGMTFTPESVAILCDPYLEGPDGTEMDLIDQCSIDFDFDDDFTEEEKQAVQDQWEADGGRSFFEGENGWELESRAVYIHGPVKLYVL